MQHKKIPLADTKAFSSFFLDYIQQKETLRPFYHRFPAPDNFKDQLAEKAKAFPQEHRQVLVAVLQKQYQGLTVSEAVSQNIAALQKPDTFAVTTGHQLNIFTGPLYFIYKIITVINACRRLKNDYPGYNFVPIYWMASEDHDYDEIKYFRLYGNKYVWHTDQQGAVGRFNTKDFKKLLAEIPGDVSVFREAYTRNSTLAGAARDYVNALFGNEGLISLDADDRDLKSLFKPVMENDIIHHKTIELVDETNKALADLGYKTQVFCRDINFFYLHNNLRARIEENDGRFHVLETDLEFSAAEIKSLIEESPEVFSPNVILRPLYQEWILPNLAYVGGPAESIYWLQLKKVFDYYEVPLPMLMPRNFGMIVDHTVKRKLEKTGLDIVHYFNEKNFLFNHWTLTNTKNDLTVGTERQTIREIYDSLKRRAESIDKTLGPFTGAEGTRVINGLERIERKLLRAEKRQHSDKLRQIEAVKDALFPNGSLQERVDNFLNFYQQDPDFIKKLMTHFDPFDYEFNILTYNGA